MKNTISLFSLLLVFTFANAQDDESYWALNLSNHFFAHNSWSRNYIDTDLDLYKSVYTSSNGFYTFQPSLRKYNDRFYTEFGLRNTGFSDETLWKSDNYSFTGNATTLSIRQVSANITAFYSKNVRLIGKHNGLYLGGDVFFNTNFIGTNIWDQIEETNTQNLRNTTLAIGSSIIPRYQYNFGERVYAEFAVVIKLISYALSFQDSYFLNGPIESTVTSTFSVKTYMSPHLSIGFKL